MLFRSQGFITIAFVSPFWALLVLRARLANRKKLLFFGIFSALFVVIIYFATAQTALSSLADFFQANFAPRIIYWTTSLFIFIHFPLFGVGMNGIFDYFREYRSAELANQLNVGLDVGSNTSHNLPIEFLVGGGIVVFVLYISLQFLVVVGYFKKRGQHSLFEKNLLTIWFAIQFQSLINPQPITLLMWNFIFGAILAAGNPIKDAVVGEKESRREAPIVSKKLTREKKHLFMYIVSILSAFSLVSSGLLLKADNQFRRAIESSDLYAIYDKSQAYPTNGNRILYAAKIMCLNGRPKEAATLVKNGMGDYPRDFELIRFALTIEEPESVRKSIANKIMKLDPQNPDLTMESLLKTEMNCGKN